MVWPSSGVAVSWGWLPSQPVFLSSHLHLRTSPRSQAPSQPKDTGRPHCWPRAPVYSGHPQRNRAQDSGAGRDEAEMFLGEQGGGSRSRAFPSSLPSSQLFPHLLSPFPLLPISLLLPVLSTSLPSIHHSLLFSLLPLPFPPSLPCLPHYLPLPPSFLSFMWLWFLPRTRGGVSQDMGMSE